LQTKEFTLLSLNRELFLTDSIILKKKLKASTVSPSCQDQILDPLGKASKGIVSPFQYKSHNSFAAT
jgi:hypothetical protein